jgi:flagellin-like hook-associated protein FlgL
MSILPVQSSRYSSLLGSDMATSQIDTIQQQLQATQVEISTGNRINQLSDDPTNSAIILQLQKTLDHQNQYLGNIQQSQSQLGEVDSSLNSLTSLVTQATTLASQDAGSTISPAQRQADATVVQTLYNQALSIGNTNFEGSYIFGGSKSNQQPFVGVNGGVQFVGSTSVLQNAASPGTLVPFQISAESVFGATSSQVTGSATLAPAATATTRISDLRGAVGLGVKLGPIQISNGTVTKQVDLSHADNLQDVVNSINGAAVGGITASINGNHLVLSAGATDNITAKDVGGGRTAVDLGILHATASGNATSVIGASLQPTVTPLTSLASLNSGAGIDTTHGLTITNGQSTATINLSGDATVEDLVNSINSAGVNVQAQINAAGTGINIINTIQGTQMTIAENGGTTAADLGIRSFSPATSLSSLNGGTGLQLAPSGPDFQITRSDGTNFTVSLAGAKTVGDAINAINTASGGVGVTASFATTGNGIVLTDTAGGSGTLAATALNGSSALTGLGLSGAASGNVINGTDVNPVVAQGLFSNLAKLRQAMLTNDQAGITAAGEALQNDQQQIITTRGQAGGQVKELQSLQNSLSTQNTSTKALIAQLQGADMPATISKFTTLQTALQGSLAVVSRTLSLSLLDFIR